jgi:hypothetical protein
MTWYLVKHMDDFTFTLYETLGLSILILKESELKIVRHLYMASVFKWPN